MAQASACALFFLQNKKHRFCDAFAVNYTIIQLFQFLRPRSSVDQLQKAICS